MGGHTFSSEITVLVLIRNSLCREATGSKNLSPSYQMCTFVSSQGSNRLQADSEDSQQPAEMRRLMCVFTGRTCNLVGDAVPRLMCFTASNIVFVPNNEVETASFSQFIRD